MFVLVEGLSVNGWLDLFGAALGAACLQSLPLTLLVVGGGSTAAANLLNNQPMTILATRVLLAPRFAAALGDDGRLLRGSRYALIIGSNVGACFTPIGALAGIMWQSLLARQGYAMSAAAFVRLCAPAGAAAAVATLVVLWAELATGRAK